MEKITNIRFFKAHHQKNKIARPREIISVLRDKKLFERNPIIGSLWRRCMYVCVHTYTRIFQSQHYNLSIHSIYTRVVCVAKITRSLNSMRVKIHNKWVKNTYTKSNVKFGITYVAIIKYDK